MKEYIDKMLHLTAEIAEELLTLKDTGSDVDPRLCEKIFRLSTLAEGNVCENPDITATGTKDEAAAIQEDEEADAMIEEARKEALESEEDPTLASFDPDYNPVDSEEIAEEQERRTDATAESAVFEQEADADETIKEENGIRHDGATPETYTRPSAEEIRNAFSINDVFLYRRVLFGGSAQRFAETIEAAAECNTTDEFRDYLAVQQHVNMKSEDAKEFMSIIAPFID